MWAEFYTDVSFSIVLDVIFLEAQVTATLLLSVFG